MVEDLFHCRGHTGLAGVLGGIVHGHFLGRLLAVTVASVEGLLVVVVVFFVGGNTTLGLVVEAHDDFELVLRNLASGGINLEVIQSTEDGVLLLRVPDTLIIIAVHLVFGEDI